MVRLEEYARDDQRFPGTIDAPNAWYRVDCAFLEIPAGMHDLVDPSLPGIGEIGSPVALDLDTMGPVGRRVSSVGSLRGGKMQEYWTYAIDINYVLDLLDVDVVSTLP